MPHALASRGDRYHDCRDRAGGGRREIRSLGAVLQGARSVASVLQSLSMTMAWMPLAVPMEFFQVGRGHGRDDFDLSFVTYLDTPSSGTYTYPPTTNPPIPTTPIRLCLCTSIRAKTPTPTYLTSTLLTYLTSTSTIHNHVKRLLHRPQHRSWSGIDRRNRLLCITRKHVRSLHDKTKGGGREHAD